jgi:hypothetical protein
MIESSTSPVEVVNDPVSHISISGVHGRDELDDRLARAEERVNGREAPPLGVLLVGAAIGIGVMLGVGALRRRAAAPAQPPTTP